jgi:deoxyribonuclease-4
MSPRLGAHMSVGGGLPRAVERAVVHRCQALQIFTKNASQWRGRTLPVDEVAGFRAAVQAADVTPIVSHASYLINLATANPALHAQSVTAMRDELERADALGLYGVVLHPGCYTAGSVEQGLSLIGDALSVILQMRGAATMVLLEHTAGQGTSLGVTFEQLAELLERTNGDPRVGVCLDTCHLLAAGYDIATPRGYAATFEAFDRCVGFDRLKLFHLNDSKKPLGSRVDRHAHIGQGRIGLEPFRWLLNDPRFRHLPMLLETPKEEGNGRGPVRTDRWDARNLGVLRRLVNRAI